MKRKREVAAGPTPGDLRMRGELDHLRRELSRLRQQVDGGGHDRRRGEGPAGVPAAPGPPTAEVPAETGPPEVGATGQDPGAAEGSQAPPSAGGSTAAAGGSEEIQRLRAQVAELSSAKQRLGRLYFTQLEENRRRQQKLHHVLESIREINTELDLDALLGKLVEAIQQSLGFRKVIVRIREDGSDVLCMRATAGVTEAEREAIAREELGVGEFLSQLHDVYKVSRSYYISHGGRAAAEPGLDQAGPSATPEFEWHGDDVLLVPLFHRQGELAACFSVYDPADRLVPSCEVVELLEIYGHHALVALENARLYHQIESRSRDVEEAGRLHHEMHRLKSTFVSTVSHELRTPLTAIRAYLDTLMVAPEGEIPFYQLQHFFAVMNEETQRLSRLIESVLDLNRFDSGLPHMTRQSVELLEIAQDTARLLEPVAQVGQVDLKVVSGCADTRLDASRDQMRQLALHLASNAVKFTPPGGSVTLAITGDAREITLEVADTGIGIPADALDRIFERFYQVDSSLSRRYGGTGLGLAICKSIVEWHGGRIQAESMPERGSRFVVCLPRRTGPRVIVRPGPRPEAAPEDILRLAIEMVAEVMGARVVSLLCPDEDGDLVVCAAMGLEERVVHESRARPGVGVAGWVAQHRRPVCVSGSDDHALVTGSGRNVYRSGTFLSVPLETEDRLLGVLNVTDPIAHNEFDAEDCHLLLQLAERVAVAWRQALEVQERQAGVEDTANTLRQVITHLERGRRRSPDRVRLARSLARELGLGESDVGVISFAASVHDIGMRQVGERVLEGSDALSDEDRREVERHPEFGAELLQPLETVGVVREVVLSHHEWWDGTGYPRGLRGEEIPIGGRILAVVDAYESMTVGRPHRSPLSRAEALSELERLRGQQFDPGVVDAFPRALDDVERFVASGRAQQAGAVPAEPRR
jgi:signal transduction histidine kinase/response regulator RpfG family c-di-GMP phosphodiesterase